MRGKLHLKLLQIPSDMHQANNLNALQYAWCYVVALAVGFVDALHKVGLLLGYGITAMLIVPRQSNSAHRCTCKLSLA